MNSVAAAAGISTLDQIKSTALNSVRWLGHQVSGIKDLVFGVVAKIINFVKPFFSHIAEYLRNVGGSMKELYVANKDIAFPAGIAAAVLSCIGIAAYIVYGNNNSEAPASSKLK